MKNGFLRNHNENEYGIGSMTIVRIYWKFNINILWYPYTSRYFKRNEIVAIILIIFGYQNLLKSPSTNFTMKFEENFNFCE